MTDRTILVIDDDTGAVDAFEAMLTTRGYVVRVARDGDAGFAAIADSAPSAVVLDLHLPTMTGLDVLRRLRGDGLNERLPVALVTGDYLIDERVADEIAALGAKLFFKPLWEDDLVEIVEGLIGESVCSICIDTRRASDVDTRAS
jgi:DNA-binding response OmpR family regulator